MVLSSYPLFGIHIVELLRGCVPAASSGHTFETSDLLRGQQFMTPCLMVLPMEYL